MERRLTQAADSRPAGMQDTSVIYSMFRIFAAAALMATVALCARQALLAGRSDRPRRD